MEGPLNIVDYINNRDHEVLSNKFEAPKRYALDHLVKDMSTNGRFDKLNRKVERVSQTFYRAANVSWSSRLNEDIYSPSMVIGDRYVFVNLVANEEDHIQREVVEKVADYFARNVLGDLTSSVEHYGYELKPIADYFDNCGEPCATYNDPVFIDRGDKIVYVNKENRKHLASALVAVFYLEDTNLTKVARLGDIGLFAVVNPADSDIQRNLFYRIVDQLIAPDHLRRGIASSLCGNSGFFGPYAPINLDDSCVESLEEIFQLNNIAPIADPYKFILGPDYEGEK